MSPLPNAHRIRLRAEGIVRQEMRAIASRATHARYAALRVKTILSNAKCVILNWRMLWAVPFVEALMLARLSGLRRVGAGAISFESPNGW